MDSDLITSVPVNRRCIIYCAPMPPPFGGFSLASQNMATHLQANGYSLKILNRSTKLRGFLVYKYIVSSLLLFAQLLLRREFQCLMYVQLSGGYGQVMDLLLMALFSPFFHKIIIHHHSFSYAKNPRLLTRIVFSFPKPIAHVCQCDHMISLLKANYPTTRHPIYKRLSNVSYNPAPHFYKPLDADTHDEYSEANPIIGRKLSCLRLGFISGPILEKGLDDSIALALSMIKNGIDIVLCLAGGSEADFSPLIQTIVKDNEFDNACLQIEYLGMLSREEIGEYISSFDCLLLPTRYKNEVEPLAILEAYSLGVPVIAKPIGCIGDIMAPHSPFNSHNLSDDFVTSCVSFLTRLALDPQFRKTIKVDCIVHYEFLLRRSNADLVDFDSMICGFFGPQLS